MRKVIAVILLTLTACGGIETPQPAGTPHTATPLACKHIVNTDFDFDGLTTNGGWAKTWTIGELEYAVNTHCGIFQSEFYAWKENR